MKRGSSKQVYVKFCQAARELVDEFRHSLAKVETEMQEKTENSNVEFVIQDGKFIGLNDGGKVITGEEIERE